VSQINLQDVKGILRANILQEIRPKKDVTYLKKDWGGGSEIL